MGASLLSKMEAIEDSNSSQCGNSEMPSCDNPQTDCDRCINFVGFWFHFGPTTPNAFFSAEWNRSSTTPFGVDPQRPDVTM